MKLLYRIIFLVGFLAILGFVIAYARGYRLDLEKRVMTSTGILAISSYPKAAKIYINNEFKGVTDQNIVLSPGNYQVDIKKDGYTNFSKKISLKGELVLTLEPVLFPVNPALSPLTNLGIVKAVPISDVDKIIIFVNNGVVDLENKNGIYLFESDKRPLPFLQSLKLIILKSKLPLETDFTKTKVTVSPDAKEAIFEFTESAYLLSLEEENLTPYDVASTLSRETLISAWKEKNIKNNIKILETFPLEFANIASDSVNIISFAPNDIKILYQANENLSIPLIINPGLIAANQTQEQRELKKGNIYVYDKKEDKNYEISGSLSIDQSIQWYFDSKHLLVNKDKKVVIMDYDGTNEQTVYSGPFENNFFGSTNDGKIIVLINLNSQVNELPDLYLVGIR